MKNRILAITLALCLITVSAWSQTPTAPTELDSPDHTTDSITLVWKAAASSDASYNIYHSTDGKNYTLAGTTAPRATSYVDKGLQSNICYWYYVKAKNGSGESAPSATKKFTPQYLYKTASGKSFSYPKPFLSSESEYPPQEVFDALVKYRMEELALYAKADNGKPVKNYSNYKEFYKKYAGYVAPPPLPIAPGKLRNLPDSPKEPRWKLTDRIWPNAPGAASVCVWEDDKLAAFSMSVDDNYADSAASWHKVEADYGGLNITWNLIAGKIDNHLLMGSDLSIPGTWDFYRSEWAKGVHFTSHTVTHHEYPILADGWPGLEWEVAESQRLIDANLPGHKTRILCPPGAFARCAMYKLPDYHQYEYHKEFAKKYMAGMRVGTGGPHGSGAQSAINRANQTDYFDLRVSDIITTPAWDAKSVTDPNYCLNTALFNPTNECYRGWLNVFTHNMNGKEWFDNDKETPAYKKPFAWASLHRQDLWIGYMDDICLYGQERDTATVTTTSVKENQIQLALTSKMDPGIFDYPLTIKVRLADSWKNIKATQAGKPIDAKIITHENAKYTLVKAKPDGGEIILNNAAN